VSERAGPVIHRLIDDSRDPPIPLPAELERRYGGPLRLAARTVFANFVASIDGVAAIGGVHRSSATISAGASADRFVVGLLRSVADAVMIGAGTLREHDGPWTAERAFPDAADAFARLRADLRLPSTPTLVVVSGSGDLPADHPSLRDAIVVTTSSGRERLSLEIAELIEGGYDDVDPAVAVAALRDRGFERILTEGGPRLMGSMLASSMVDELFLTVSPRLIGGARDGQPLTDHADVSGMPSARLVAAGRDGDYLFLRYAIERSIHPRSVRSATCSSVATVGPRS
jgi:riboflavin biosynthesis pyrimidine reductase